jgi:hypothetical protein
VATSLPLVRLAGRSTGSPTWMKQLRPFVAAERRLRLVTVHRYPLKRCSSSDHVTAGELLARSSTQGLANSVVQDVAIARAHGLSVRIDEMNSLSCGGQPGVSDSFASALWSLDALFQMALCRSRRREHPHDPWRTRRVVHISPGERRLGSRGPTGVLRPDDVRAGCTTWLTLAQPIRGDRRHASGLGHARARRPDSRRVDQYRPGSCAPRLRPGCSRFGLSRARMARRAKRSRHDRRDARRPALRRGDHHGPARRSATNHLNDGRRRSLRRHPASGQRSAADAPKAVA